MIVCAGKTEQFDFAHPIGVGLIESAMNLTRLCLFDKPEFLLFIGSAGSYGEYEPFEIVQSRGATQIELSFLDKHSYTPIENVITSEGLNVSHETLINSSNYITTSNKYWPQMQKLQIGAENMEFFALMQVAKEFAIPAGGIFIITNYCDENAHEAYRNNYKKAMQKLADHIRSRFFEKKHS